MECIYIRLEDPHLRPALRRYTQLQLKGILQLMGCKPLHAFQMSEKVMSTLSAHTDAEAPSEEPIFLATVKSALNELGYQSKGIMSDFELARRVKDREQSVCILLGGTSGCGKSTLASLLASRIGLTTVLSTDNVRHLLRNFLPQEKYPVLWASSYHAGEVEGSSKEGTHEGRIISGFEEQNNLLFDKLDDIIGNFERRKESLVVEGVHLSVDVMIKLMKRHPTCIPFLIYISNETKHTERFAIRAKYMTLEPRLNKYVKYFGNIRIIQNYLGSQADLNMIPKIDNTNVDRSLAVVHRTVFGCLRRIDKENRNMSHQMSLNLIQTQEDTSVSTTELEMTNFRIFDETANKPVVLYEIFNKIHRSSMGSKEMLKVIKQKSVQSEKSKTKLTTKGLNPLSSIHHMAEDSDSDDDETTRQLFGNFDLKYSSLGS